MLCAWCEGRWAEEDRGGIGGKRHLSDFPGPLQVNDVAQDGPKGRAGLGLTKELKVQDNLEARLLQPMCRR